MAFPGTNAFIGGDHGAEVFVAIAPPWASLIAKSYPDIETVQERLWEHAALPADWWPKAHQREHEALGRIDEHGRVPLVKSPERIVVLVCGGLGNLHALAMHSFGPTQAVTRPF